VQRGLSAGRVQSVAVRIICEREAEVQAFVSEEYWNITALLDGKLPPSFEARLTRIDSKKLKLTNETQTKEVLEILKGASFIVTKVEKRRRNVLLPLHSPQARFSRRHQEGFVSQPRKR